MSTTTDPTPQTGQPPQQRLTVLGPNLFGCPTEFRVASPMVLCSIMGPDEVPGGLHNPATLPNAIREFRAGCVRDEYTDTGTAWELLDQAELLLDTIAEAVGL